MSKAISIFLLLLSACSPSLLPNPASEQTLAENLPPAASATEFALQAATPTGTAANTSVPTESPPQSTIEVTDTAANAPENLFARHAAGSQGRAGGTVEIARILVSDKETLNPSLYPAGFFSSEIFANKLAVVWLVFNISNNSDYTIHLHPGEARLKSLDSRSS